MTRYGSVLGLKPDAVEAYRALHAEVWPTVLKALRRAHITNYSIYLKEPENLLFSYFEYRGTDYAADMSQLSADSEIQRWWDICIPMQSALETRAPGEWWAEMTEVFHAK
jgi:L-rhamnose mutarotase